MSATYLLDTNVLSEPLRADPNRALLARLLRERDGLATAAPVIHELRYGAQRLPESRRRGRIEDYLSDVLAWLPVLPYDRRAAEWHAVERARLAAEGLTPPFVDTQIAAIATTHALTLVTANLRGFQRFDGLRTEDWR